MSEDRWTIERMMDAAHEMGVLKARQNATEQTVDRIGVRLEESIDRNGAHMRGEIARVETMIVETRRSTDEKIAGVAAKLTTEINTAVDRSHARATEERARELGAQNAEISGQLREARRENRWLIVGGLLLLIAGEKAIEHANDILNFIRGLN